MTCDPLYQRDQPCRIALREALPIVRYLQFARTALGSRGMKEFANRTHGRLVRAARRSDAQAGR